MLIIAYRCALIIYLETLLTLFQTDTVINLMLLLDTEFMRCYIKKNILYYRL